MYKRVALIIVLIAIIFLFFYLNLDAYLTVESAKRHIFDLNALIANHLLLSMAIFFIVYVLATVLSLPSSIIMSLAAGAFFGLSKGLIIASFASAIGATASFLVSRYIFRDFVRKHFGNKLKRVDNGMKRQGAFYLFTLRILPGIPFTLVNALMGVTSIKIWTFYWVSQVGMIAETAVYANAGTQLAEINNLQDILSPSIILSFVLLAIFPWLAQFLVNVFNKRRVYKNYKKPDHFDYNLVVIGAGSGGLVSSYIAAAVKSKVALIEAGKMGGDCLNYGCVPSKAIIKTAKTAHQIRHADKYGIESGDTRIAFKEVMSRVRKIIQGIAPNDSIERYQKLGVNVIKGYATIKDPWTILIKFENGDSQTITTKSIIIATGAKPFVPELPGVESSGYLTSDTLWAHLSTLEEVPKRLLILGGGPIGCELAQAFARLGSNVTQIERGSHLMGREDADVAEYVKDNFENEGISVLIGHKALRFENDGGERYLVTENQGKETYLPYDEVIIAAGRRARLDGFGLEELGVTSGKSMQTDQYLQTLFPNIYAVGDVVQSYQFTHVAAHHAWYATVNALFGSSVKRFKVDNRIIPWVTFTDPEIARVGLSEVQAEAENIEYEITKLSCAALDRAATESAEAGFIKVLTQKNKDKILGVTIIAERAGEMLPEFVLAMKYKIGLNKLLGTIHAYPTWGEGAKYVAGKWKQAHQPTNLLKWVEKYHTWRRK